MAGPPHPLPVPAKLRGGGRNIPGCSLSQAPAPRPPGKGAPSWSSGITTTSPAPPPPRSTPHRAPSKTPETLLFSARRAHGPGTQLSHPPPPPPAPVFTLEADSLLRSKPSIPQIHRNAYIPLHPLPRPIPTHFFPRSPVTSLPCAPAAINTHGGLLGFGAPWEVPPGTLLTGHTERLTPPPPLRGPFAGSGE